MYTRLSRQGQQRATLRAIEDAYYAVRLAERAAAVEELLEVRARDLMACSRSDSEDAAAMALGCEVGYGEATVAATEAWESLAEAFEAARDIEGAIFAYEQLLTLEPSSSPGLSAATSAKRGVQEVVLQTHRRGLADTRYLGRGFVRATDKSRQQVTSRALQDVEALRLVVTRDLDTVEQSIATRKPTSFASKALTDIRTLRKIALADINRLQMTLVRGACAHRGLPPLGHALATPLPRPCHAAPRRAVLHRCLP